MECQVEVASERSTNVKKYYHQSYKKTSGHVKRWIERVKPTSKEVITYQTQSCKSRNHYGIDY